MNFTNFVLKEHDFLTFLYLSVCCNNCVLRNCNNFDIATNLSMYCLNDSVNSRYVFSWLRIDANLRFDIDCTFDSSVNKMIAERVNFILFYFIFISFSFHFHFILFSFYFILFYFHFYFILFHFIFISFYFHFISISLWNEMELFPLPKLV